MLLDFYLNSDKGKSAIQRNVGYLSDVIHQMLLMLLIAGGGSNLVRAAVYTSILLMQNPSD